MRSSLSVSASATCKALPGRHFRRSRNLHDQVRTLLFKTSTRFNRERKLLSLGTVIAHASNLATRINLKHPPVQVPSEMPSRQSRVTSREHRRYKGDAETGEVVCGTSFPWIAKSGGSVRQPSSPSSLGSSPVRRSCHPRLICQGPTWRRAIRVGEFRSEFESWFARIEASRPRGCATHAGRPWLRLMSHPITDVGRSMQDRSLRR